MLEVAVVVVDDATLSCPTFPSAPLSVDERVVRVEAGPEVVVVVTGAVEDVATCELAVEVEVWAVV